VIRVVVVDDEPMVCAHLRTILGSAGTIEVAGEAHEGAAAWMWHRCCYRDPVAATTRCLGSGRGQVEMSG
jgi:DNA-binding NarL/FixJ family response regulator